MLTADSITSKEKPLARAGLIAKGTVYCLLGLLAFMTAFHIGGQTASQTDKSGVFDFIYQLTGGKILLALVAAGLVCYCIWRMIQAFGDTESKGTDAKGLAIRGRYLFSGLVYGSLAFYAGMMLFSQPSGSGDNNQDLVRELLSKPFGQYLVGIAAAILLGVGIYQINYGLSEKYRKHVDRAGGNKEVLLGAGKIGYVARGIVWLVIAWLFFKAALKASSAEAGDTAKAFGWLQEATYGSYLLGAVGIGLIFYGVFNFIRARYENFN
ncbi:MAG TPA: DUF1206 domain-containing protein [Sphingobacteriaceae bacterium]